ncbi:MAG: argininosuccinate lyase [archaeon]|nr:argininosuccinate lyase [archaeon]
MKNILDKHRKDPIKEEVLPFLSSLNEDKWILEEDVIGSIVHVIMLKKQDIINLKDAQLILKELISIFNSIKNNNFKINPDFEDIHPFIESIIIEKIGIECGGKIHSARSRNDQVALDIRLKIRKELIILLKCLLELMDNMIKLAEKSVDFYCPLYTHLQRAQLGTFAHFIINYCYQILRIMKKVIFCCQDINYNPLGACAIGGTSFPIDRKFTSELLGFNGEITNSIDAVSSRDFVIFPMMILTLIADCFSRISEDFIIWSSKEFNFIEIDDGYASVSSAMPQKKNPDTLELIKGKMGRIYGGLTHLLFMSKGTPSGYVRDFQESKVPLKEAFETMKYATKILTGVMSTIKLNKENMNRAVEHSMILSLDLAEFLAKNTELSFREGHSLVGALVKKYHTKEKIFNKDNIKKISEEIFNKSIIIKQIDLNLLKNPEYALDIRISLGSPSKKNCIESINGIKEKLTKYSLEIDNLNNKFKDSIKNILNEADKIIKSN